MKKIACLLVCFSVIQTGSSIKCYNCQSSSGNDCRDYSKITIAECMPERNKFPPVCIRKIMKGESETNITLQCTSIQTGHECEPPSTRYNVTECRICQENLCNNDVQNQANLGLIAVMSLVFIFAVTRS